MSDETQSQKDVLCAYQDALIGMFVQAGVTLEDGRIDTNQISVSAYEQAFRLLERDGRVKRHTSRGRLFGERVALYFTNAQWVGALPGPE